MALKYYQCIAPRSFVFRTQQLLRDGTTRVHTTLVEFSCTPGEVRQTSDAAAQEAFAAQADYWVEVTVRAAIDHDAVIDSRRDGPPDPF